MPSDATPQVAHFNVQSVFAVGGQAVLTGKVVYGEMAKGMTTTIGDKQCEVLKIDPTGKVSPADPGVKAAPVVGITLSAATIEDMQNLKNGELVFVLNKTVE